MATTAGTERAERALGSRLGAITVAFWWAVLFFGVIDLMVGIFPSKFPDEYDWYPIRVVATSWGLLYTVLLPVPLIAGAVRPTGWVGPQIAAVATGVLLAGVAAPAPGQIFVAFLVAASGAFPRMWIPRPRWSMRPLAATPGFWPIGVLVALGLVAGLVHAWDVLGTARDSAPDDDTWGLMHLPMQAGFALAIPTAAAVALLAMANRVTGWWFAVVPPAASAVWFGVFCATHPDLLGSVGETAGWGTAAWGVVTAAGMWAAAYLTRRDSPRTAAPSRL